MGMERYIIIVNVGSSSKKYALYRGQARVFDAHFEHTESGFAVTCDGEERALSAAEYEASLNYFLELARAHGFDGALAAVGMRSVAPGSFFAAHRMFDEEYRTKLAEVAHFDPVHIRPMQQLYEEVRRSYPDIQVVAVSDSAFHQSLPSLTREYPLPQEVRERFDMHRFGYHGIALQDIAQQVSESRTVVCYLGSGSSVGALKDGVSVEHSMGYSSLEGLTSSTRSGDVDPGAVVRLVQSCGVEEVLDMLYQQSGLLGMSGVSSDMRVLLKEEEHNEAAREAVSVFTHRIAQYVARAAVTLGGIDALVFSGTIGVRSAPVRAKVCAWLEGVLPIALDVGANEQTAVVRNIAKEGSVPLYVLHADESGAMMRAVTEVLGR